MAPVYNVNTALGLLGRNAPSAIIADLCKQKAGFLAHQSIKAATRTRQASAVLLWVLTVILNCMARHSVAKTHCCSERLDKEMPRRIPQKRRARFFAAATLLLGVVAVFEVLSLYSVQYKFYCETDPQWSRWNREWTAMGFAAGLPAALAVADWLFFATNVILGRTGAGTHMECPFSAALIGVGAALIVIVVRLLVYTPYWLLFSCGMGAFQPYRALSDYAGMNPWRQRQDIGSDHSDTRTGNGIIGSGACACDGCALRLAELAGEQRGHAAGENTEPNGCRDRFMAAQDVAGFSSPVLEARRSTASAVGGEQQEPLGDGLPQPSPPSYQPDSPPAYTPKVLSAAGGDKPERRWVLYGDTQDLDSQRSGTRYISRTINSTSMHPKA